MTGSRRWLLPLGAAAAILVVAFGAIVVLGPSGAPGAFRGAPAENRPPSFDPLLTRATPSWLPDGFTAIGLLIGAVLALAGIAVAHAIWVKRPGTSARWSATRPPTG